MSEDIEALRATALVRGHIRYHMSRRIAVVDRRRRWSTDQELAILRKAFGAKRWFWATCQRQAICSGQLHSWRWRAIWVDRRLYPTLYSEVDMSVPTAAMVGNGPIGIELQSG